ncbi:MAG TPA: ATP-grasp domain-containing protein [Candidatus Dormibacteraeota bacterium]
MRSLGRLGVGVYGLTHNGSSAASSSRYCAGTLSVGLDGRPWPDEARTLGDLVAAGRRLGGGTILIPGSDEWSVFVASHSSELARWFRFPVVPLHLVEELAAKDGLYRLATTHGLPTPRIVFPASRDEALSASSSLQYPVMLKPVRSRPDVLEKAVANNAQQLVDSYRWMEESPGAPNVMFQEYIPGTDSDVWIFNGYFDSQSRCLAAFTGVKIRQHPAKMGIASLGELRQNSTVIEATCDFMRAVGYRGIVDIGYRFDSRDGQYKVLDINPRLGGAFRMFVDKHGMDVARAMYLDLTGRPVPAIAPSDGRRWINESADLVASTHYRRLDGLTLTAWLRSFRGVREGATWGLDDPLPFAVAMYGLVHETLAAKWDRFRKRAYAALNKRFAPRVRSGENTA